MNDGLARILLIPLLLAVLVYFGFIVEEVFDGLLALSASTVLLLLPTAVVAIVFEVAVLMPLWSLVAERKGGSAVAFALLATLIWLACSTLLLQVVSISDADLESYGSIIVPGLVLVFAFGIVAGWLRRKPGHEAVS